MLLPFPHPSHTHTRRHSVDIQDAYKLLSPTLGAKAASVIFALALLASGQNSTITGTLAGQVVMEGACLCVSVKGVVGACRTLGCVASKQLQPGWCACRQHEPLCLGYA